MGFEDRKRIALEKLKDDLKKGRVDPKILKTLELINSLDDFYSLSSCSGRISLLRFDEEFKKGKEKFIFKKHEKTSASEIFEKLKEFEKKESNVMFLMEGSILHVSARSLSKALSFLKEARNLGFKRGGIISIRKGEVIMEIESTEKICTPVIINSKIVINEELLSKIVEISNSLLERTWKKLEKLNKYLNSMKKQL